MALTEYTNSIHPWLHVRSPLGQRAHLSVIGLFYTSEHLFRAYRSGTHQYVIKQLNKAVELAREGGGTVVAGLGGFHSIISSNGRRLRAAGMAETLLMGLEGIQDQWLIWSTHTQARRMGFGNGGQAGIHNGGVANNKLAKRVRF